MSAESEPGDVGGPLEGLDEKQIAKAEREARGAAARGRRGHDGRGGGLEGGRNTTPRDIAADIRAITTARYGPGATRSDIDPLPGSPSQRSTGPNARQAEGFDFGFVDALGLLGTALSLGTTGALSIGGKGLSGMSTGISVGQAVNKGRLQPGRTRKAFKDFRENKLGLQPYTPFEGTRKQKLGE